ncbi:hypothetical protein [Streptomyces griseoaurantiacus]|uniref:Lipoprotein n=1 Tax=Streptomyces griseoaurantiacus TaxID=68213 RepID=A0A1G7KHF6_9ACTN|nr:hypothetical protein [Streptomyces jietaisiensis]SDF36454.1 hypothetical protein SAMN05216260_107313 [Streptomyces jietaisiensis]
MADIRRQLRSGTVVLGSVGLLAAALTACSSDPDKRCVDKDSYEVGKGYRTVDGKYCGSSGGTGKSDGSGSSGINGVWYYGGSKKGQRVKGGSLTKPRSGSGSSGGGGVKRGGFGGKGGGSGS